MPPWVPILGSQSHSSTQKDQKLHYLFCLDHILSTDNQSFYHYLLGTLVQRNIMGLPRTFSIGLGMWNHLVDTRCDHEEGLSKLQVVTHNRYREYYMDHEQNFMFLMNYNGIT